MQGAHLDEGIESMDPARIRSFVEAFTDDDCAVDACFMPAARMEELRIEVGMLRSRGLFQAAGIGPRAERREEVRGDHILWIAPDSTPVAWQLVERELESLRAALNGATFLGLHDFEGHYALYPPGAAYARHVDNFRGDSNRLISVVLYLNEDWSGTDGGELCLYPKGRQEPVWVMPHGGTLACFLSEGMMHEVRPARRERLSLTGWFRRRPI